MKDGRGDCDADLKVAQNEEIDNKSFAMKVISKQEIVKKS